MKRSIKTKILLAASGLFIFNLLSSSLHAQSFSYRTYDRTNGFPGSYLYGIGQDSEEGFLWLGLEEGLYRFDGFDFYKMDLPDTLTKGKASAFSCDDTGTMWIGFTDGSLYKWRRGSELVRQNIEAERISKILNAPDGNTWIVTQTSGIYVDGTAQTEKLEKITAPEMNIYDLEFLGGDSLLIGTADNLYVCTLRNNEIIILQSFPELEYKSVKCLARLTEGKWIAGTTNGDGLFLISHTNQKFSATQVTGHPSIEGVSFTDIIADNDKTLLAATQDAGAIKLEFGNDYSAVHSFVTYNKETGLPGNFVNALFKDREGNLWIGLFDTGLSAVTTSAFSFYIPEKDKAISFIGESEGKILMGTRNGLYDYNPLTGVFFNYRELKNRTGGSGITAWKVIDKGNILIGTSNSGLWQLNKSGSVKQLWRSDNPGRCNINGIDTDDQNIWLATLDGLVQVDKSTGKQKNVFTTIERLPDNEIMQVFTVKNGEVLAVMESEKLQYVNAETGVRTSEKAMRGTGRNIMQGISVSKTDSSIWVCTLGNGLFRISKDEVMNIMPSDGLYNEYCYSILAASDGRIWTGHEKGFSVVDTRIGRIRTFNRDFGLRGMCLPNAIAETSDGNIYIGTTEGIVAYNPAMERPRTVNPQANIISVTINNMVYPYRQTYSLPYKKRYSVHVNYAGIFLSDPLNVTYRTRLENEDEDWISTEDRTVSYSLRDGHYHFTVEAAAKDNLKEVTTASFDILIQKPFFRRWWFILSIVFISLALVYILFLLRERAHRKQREYLEAELSKRTAEVHQQKEELFQKNQDITESIKYAKKIQSSVLPDTNRLSGIFSDNFVFYLPRDIVSGDFFWFDWVDKDKFVVVCADSTGHGVPGAFMSMIGSALLQDIVTRKKIIKPSEILHELDRRIFSTLNQNQEVEATNDGMDIIVCEFNLKTRHVIFASAMRPVILIIDGEQQYIRGNRSAVGGESASEKFFDDQEYHLREGDIIYLFSDGYPDQFGGPGNKKMKISRLRSLIDEVKSLPLSEQKERLSDYFFEWKGDNDQIDDVLMMAIKV